MEHYFLSCIRMTQTIAGKLGIGKTKEGWLDWYKLDGISYYPVSDIPTGKWRSRKLQNTEGETFIFLS